MPKITAISSLGWTQYTLYEALPRMQARGFHRIEIASFNKFNHIIPLCSSIDTSAKTLECDRCCCQCETD